MLKFVIIQGEASKECPRFCKCLIFSKYGFSRFRMFWPPKVTSTCIKQPVERDSDGNNNKVYIRITDNFHPLLNVFIRLDGS